MGTAITLDGLDGTNSFKVDIGKALMTKGYGWTVSELLPEVKTQNTFTKDDFENALKKVSRKVKK